MLTRKTAIALLIMMNLLFLCASCAAAPDGGASGEPQEPAAEETAGDETTDPLALAPGTEVDPGDDADQYFLSVPIPDSVFEMMNGRSYTEGGEISREELRYLRVLYVDYEGVTRTGELVVNQDAAEDTLAVFRDLYDAAYPVCKMVLVDNYYDIDFPGYEHLDRGNRADCVSIEDNNTSAFNYRQISTMTGDLSNHAFGRAIDFNPYENPYVNADGTLDGPEGSAEYLDRSKATVENHMLHEGDPAVSAFKAHGFTWGGDWTGDKDYQHFDHVGEK